MLNARKMRKSSAKDKYKISLERIKENWFKEYGFKMFRVSGSRDHSFKGFLHQFTSDWRRDSEKRIKLNGNSLPAYDEHKSYNYHDIVRLLGEGLNSKYHALDLNLADELMRLISQTWQNEMQKCLRIGLGLHVEKEKNNSGEGAEKEIEMNTFISGKCLRGCLDVRTENCKMINLCASVTFVLPRSEKELEKYLQIKKCEDEADRLQQIQKACATLLEHAKSSASTVGNVSDKQSVTATVVDWIKRIYRKIAASTGEDVAVGDTPLTAEDLKKYFVVQTLKAECCIHSITAAGKEVIKYDSKKISLKCEDPSFTSRVIDVIRQLLYLKSTSIIFDKSETELDFSNFAKEIEETDKAQHTSPKTTSEKIDASMQVFQRMCSNSR